MLLNINPKEYLQCYYYSINILIKTYQRLLCKYQQVKLLNPNLCLIKQQKTLRERDVFKKVMMHNKLSTRSSYRSHFWITNIIKCTEDKDNEIQTNKMTIDEYPNQKDNDIKKLLVNEDSSIDSIETFTNKLSYEYDMGIQRSLQNNHHHTNNNNHCHCRNHSEGNPKRFRFNNRNASEKLNHCLNIEKTSIINNNSNLPKASLPDSKIILPLNIKVPIANQSTYIIKPLFRSTKSFINNLKNKQKKEKEVQKIYEDMLKSVQSVITLNRLKSKSFNIPKMESNHSLVKKIAAKAFPNKGKFPSMNYFKHRPLLTHEFSSNKKFVKMNTYKSIVFINRL